MQDGDEVACFLGGGGGVGVAAGVAGGLGGAHVLFWSCESVARSTVGDEAEEEDEDAGAGLATEYRFERDWER